MEKLSNLTNKHIAFSGFRDDKLYDLLNKIYNMHYDISITQNCNFLIIDDVDKPYYSAKRKLAYKYNIPIIEKSDFIKYINYT